MLNEIKRLFRKLTPLEVASRELVDAELSKLESESAQEWATAAVAYNAARIKRLRAFIATFGDK